MTGRDFQKLMTFSWIYNKIAEGVKFHKALLGKILADLTDYFFLK